MFVYSYVILTSHFATITLQIDFTKTRLTEISIIHEKIFAAVIDHKRKHSPTSLSTKAHKHTI